MYKVRTKFGMTYNYVHSWKKWDLNEDFIEFVWGKGTSREKLIIPIAEILAIEKDT